MSRADHDYLKDLKPEQAQYRMYTRGVAIGSPHGVRTYRYSPDRVVVQVRTGKGHATAYLDFETAMALADAIKNAVTFKYGED